MGSGQSSPNASWLAATPSSFTLAIPPRVEEKMRQRRRDCGHRRSLQHISYQEARRQIKSPWHLRLRYSERRPLPQSVKQNSRRYPRSQASTCSRRISSRAWSIDRESWPSCQLTCIRTVTVVSRTYCGNTKGRRNTIPSNHIARARCIKLFRRTRLRGRSLMAKGIRCIQSGYRRSWAAPMLLRIRRQR
jgi:hypothetical protein